MAKCKTCKAPIIWAVTDKGKSIPLDMKGEKRYVLVPAQGDRDPVVELRTTYASHFVTCPDAKEHRKK